MKNKLIKRKNKRNLRTTCLIALLCLGVFAILLKPVAASDTYFTADRIVIAPDECVTISWAIPEASHLTLDKWLYGGRNWTTNEAVETSGSFDYCDDSQIYSLERPFLSAHFDLIDHLPSLDSVEYTLNIYVLPAESSYSPDAFAIQDSELSDPPNYPADSEEEVVYQAFEHGFMLHLLPASCVFSIYTEGYYDYEAGIGYYQPLLWPENAYRPANNYAVCVYDESFPENPVSEIPEGFVLPTGAIGSIWGNNSNIRNILGNAVSEELYYLPDEVEEIMPQSPQMWDSLVVILPDGQGLYCGLRAATQGTCTVRMPFTGN